MFVVLERLEELIIFGKGLTSGWCFRHVVIAVGEFFTPEGDGLLSFVSHVGLHEFLQFFVAGDLSSVFEAEGFFEVFVDVGEVYGVSALVVHDEFADLVLVEGFGGESGGVGGLEMSLPGFFFFPALLIFDAELNFFEVLGLNQWLLVVRKAGASCPFSGVLQLCFCPSHNYLNRAVLIILGLREGVIGAPEDPIFGVVFVLGNWEGLGVEQVLVLFGEMGFGGGSSIPFFVAVHSFFVPVGDEGA